MPESLLQKAERLNQEITHLTEAKFNILSCQDPNVNILDAIEDEILRRSEWIDLNSVKSIHAMIFQLLHSFRDRPIISTDSNEKIILKYLISHGFVDVKKIKKENGRLATGYILAQNFEILPNVEDLYQIYIKERYDV